MATDLKKIFGKISNDEIEISTITKNDLNEALDVLNRSFLLYECVCIGTEINLPESKQARADLTELCRIVANDGVSLMAKHLPTNRIVSVCFNKIQFTDDSADECFFAEFRNKHCKSPNAKALMQYMITMDERINVFDIYNINCLLEIMFLGTLPEFERKQIGYTLCKYSIDLAKDLSAGHFAELINPELRSKRPKAVTALFTSSFSQRIGKKLNFNVLNCVPYSEFNFNGKSFDERIGPMHPNSEQVCIKF